MNNNGNKLTHYLHIILNFTDLVLRDTAIDKIVALEHYTVNHCTMNNHHEMNTLYTHYLYFTYLVLRNTAIDRIVIFEHVGDLDGIRSETILRPLSRHL